MTALAKLTAIVIDCADPAGLAAFYSKVTGWEVTYSDADYASVGADPIQIGLQRVEGYASAGWPSSSKHMHLDFAVDDVAAATKELLAIGATLPEYQPGDGKWVVLADPEGHVFCIAAAS